MVALVIGVFVLVTDYLSVAVVAPLFGGRVSGAGSAMGDCIASDESPRLPVQVAPIIAYVNSSTRRCSWHPNGVSPEPRVDQ